MNNSYTFPKDFDPYLAIYALKGLAEASYKYYTEGGGVHRAVPEGHHENLLGLSWLARRVSNELVDYLAALDDADVRLPVSDVELMPDEVREERAPYLVGAGGAGIRAVMGAGNTAQ